MVPFEVTSTGQAPDPIDPGDGGEIIQIKPYYIYNLHVYIDNIYLLSEVDV